MDTMKRRTLLGIGILGASALAGPRQLYAAALSGEDTEIPLWPGDKPPDGSGPQGPERINVKGSLTNISRPRMVAYRPQRPNGSAMLVIAGGGYAHIERGTENIPAARWLQALGITVFELVYRLPGEGWSKLAPFQDGQRAMRLIRASAAKYGLDARRIGVLGFSAGGHLAGTTAAEPDAPRYAASDVADQLSARPDFVGLIYPVLSFMPPYDNTHSRREIIGKHPDPAESEAFSVERHVGAGMPATFLAQAADDPISPIQNSLLMFNALKAARIPAEMHVFQEGGHGWGLGPQGSLVHAWPALFETWIRHNGWMGSD
ncbi:alpha/beta hydrolase [Collimonas humicola]|uniref:alpha/beta hydrolase n=1 Tax=Collimonas humicola TaxID=2825886 RepID=UPI001B8BA2DE|nr:alpha/beta hydrolase [Collimonas humicola]